MFYVINEILEMVAHIVELDRIYKYRHTLIGSPLLRAIASDKRKNKHKKKKRKAKKPPKGFGDVRIPGWLVDFMAGYAMSKAIDKICEETKEERENE